MEAITRKYVKRYGFLSFGRNLSNKYGKHLLKTGINVLKTASKKQFIKQLKQRVNFQEIKLLIKLRNLLKKFIPLEKSREILNELRQVLSKLNTINYLIYQTIHLYQSL